MCCRAHRIGVVEFHDRNAEPEVLSVLTTNRQAILERTSRFSQSIFDPGSSRIWDSVVAGADLFTTSEQNPRAIRALVFLSEGEGYEQRQCARRLEGHDLSGRLFHTLLTDAKFTGAYYTSVSAATLL